MKWFRSNIECHSRVALFALTIQFALSFGHFHGVAERTVSAAQAGSADFALPAGNYPTAQVAYNSSAPQPASHRDSGGHSGDICAICALIAMANAASFATPPVVLLPRAVDFCCIAAKAEFGRIVPVRVAFRPRAPPVS